MLEKFRQGLNKIESSSFEIENYYQSKKEFTKETKLNLSRRNELILNNN